MNREDATRDKEKTGNLLNIDQQILKDRIARKKNVTILWIKYKKANNMVSQFWIVDCEKCTSYLAKPWKTGKWSKQQEEKYLQR